MKKYKYVCEVCGKQSIYDNPEDAVNEGWDIPPFIGMYGVISPRTCPDCTVENTVWLKLENHDTLNRHDLEVIDRIKHEPEIFEIEVEDE